MVDGNKVYFKMWLLKFFIAILSYIYKSLIFTIFCRHCNSPIISSNHHEKQKNKTIQKNYS